MTLALGLHRDTGKVHCPDPLVTITYNEPFPCPNGRLGVTGKMDGVVQHTMAGYLAGAIRRFNDPAAQASAHFGISQAGRIHQFGPIGKGWQAWHAFAANTAWYGIEFEDAGNPDIPISDAALTAGAQVIEFLSRFAGFPLEVCDWCNGQGLACHSLCAAWNLDHHTCPDLPPRHVRSSQRAEIIHRAHLIRNPAPVAPTDPVQLVGDGHTTWGQLAARHGLRPHHLAWWTAQKMPAGYGPEQRAALEGLASQTIPAGMVLWAAKYPPAAAAAQEG